MRLGLGSALLLAACSDAGADNHNDDSQRRVSTMGETERNAVLLQAIHQAHRRCGAVIASRPVEPAGGPVPTYVAECDGPDDYVVFIRPGGRSEVQVTWARGVQ